jgi:aminocarboxymuconate-semialdehyde decarboxylase
MVFSNIQGAALHDKRYWPLWEKAAERGGVVYIHPTYPLGVEAMKEYMLMPLVGFLMDTTLAAAGLVFGGVTEKFPQIRWVLTHMGGAVPYLAERFDRGYRAFPECRKNVSRPPSEVLREFYYDTVNFEPACMRLALDFAGPSRVLAGSDYPHQIGSLRGMVEVIDGAPLGEQEKQAVRFDNTAALLGLGEAVA